MAIKNKEKTEKRYSGILRFLTSAFAILSLVLGGAYLFVLPHTEDVSVPAGAVASLLIALALSQLSGRRVIDERQIRISARANKMGILALMAYCVIIALLAMDNPGVLDVRLAVGGALFSEILVSMVVFQILMRLPNAEHDKWESA